MDVDFSNVMRKILRDISKDLGDEYDKNFERQGFFSQKWKRSMTPPSKGTILMNTGSLRRSIINKISGNSIVFSSTLPYADIQNEGGEITVTERMHKFFLYKMLSLRGGFGRKKNGALRQDKRNAKLSGEAEFWKWMACKPIGSKIKIPKRQFIGYSPEVEQQVIQIIEKNLTDYFNSTNILR